MQNLGSALLIPECDFVLLLRDKSLPQGFVNEYNFTTTKEAMGTEVPRGENRHFLVFSFQIKFSKVTTVLSNTHTVKRPLIC